MYTKLQLSSELSNKKGILGYVYKYVCHMLHLGKIMLIT